MYLGFLIQNLWSAGIVLLFDKLTVSIIPPYSTNHTHPGRGEMYSGKGLKKTCWKNRKKLPNSALYFHSFSLNCLWVYLDKAHGEVNSRVKFGRGRSVLGSNERNWRERGRRRGVSWCWPAVLRALRYFRWPEPPLLPHFCLSWSQMPYGS